ncbi:hypothetical protein [Paraburkholderia phenazinium]|uniref:Secreted protein n=1 Tax=Paraburkholderia phenazinium TaxID=60549 RepID=A0A1G8NXZ5_9BURK|nr:hypothetical protein [Paraburkholderia phenazinium]SDI85084.1 hypothetical protein SAMN05216466_13822 [Paraburkholderia phenazinium]
MSKSRSGIIVLCLAACCLCAVSVYADDDAMSDQVQSAGRGAHLGRDLCGYTPEQIAHYKADLKRSLASPANFDTDWDYGWQRAQPILLQYQSLKAGDPQDYESRVRLVCATMRNLVKRAEKSGAPQQSAQ